MILPAIAGVGLGAAGLLSWAVRGRSCQWLAPSVWKGPNDRKVIALTFDDGPSESTQRVLDLLAKHNTTATFFQIGQNVERLPSVTRQVTAAGCEVGNHSFTHPRFDFTSTQFQIEELQKTQQAIANACGVPPKWFRAPFGVRWFGLGKAQNTCGLKGAMWTVLARDWILEAAAIEKRILSGAVNGAILCLHDGRGTISNPDISQTIKALEVILPTLNSRGFQLVSLSELLNRFSS